MRIGILHYLMLAVGCAIGYSIGIFIGIPMGVDKQEGKQAIAVVKKVGENVKTKTKVNALSNDELKSEYCHWVYDVPYDECIRTNIYVNTK